MIEHTPWRHVNSPGAPVHAIYRHLTDTTSIYWPANVRDISTTAIRLLVPRPVRPGRLLSLRLSSPNEAAPITRLVMVVGFQSHGATWLLVGLFTEPLTEEELQQLVPEEAMCGTH